MIIKTKLPLRPKIWYFQMDRQIELFNQNCLPCQAKILKHCQEPLKMTELPSGSWEHIPIDFKGPLP